MSAIGPEDHARDLMRRAREHLRTGRPDHAEALAEVALAWNPANDEAMAVLGRTALLRGDHARAAALLTAALAHREDAASLADLAHALVALDRRAEAVAAFRRAAALAPADGGLANDLGVALAQAGQIAEAEPELRRAVALRPDIEAAWGNLATALRQLGREDDAAALRPPARPAPDDADTQDTWAETLSQAGRHDEALAVGRTAVALRPDDAELRRRHAHRLQLAGHLAEAEAELRRAIALQPESLPARTGLAWVLRRQGRLAEAIDTLSALAARWPDDPRVLNGLAMAVRDAGRSEEALAWLDRAIAVDPADAEVQHNRATVLLRLGRYHEGWEAYEWRWQMAQGQAVRRAFPQKLWGGEALDGRTILLHAEQGLGDTLQFLRYVPLVAARGGRVVLEVPSALARLAGSLPGIAELVWAGDRLPEFDLHCPLMSLPRAFGTTLESIPPAPYLSAPANRVAAWRERSARPAGLAVGLVWAGRMEHRDDASRSVRFDALAPLWLVPGVRWFSVQVGPRAADLVGAPPGVVTDLSPLLGDFADTAAALSALDLLLTVDTAPAHLAGALGVPAWVMLPHASEWRWMQHRDDTPWYPSLRLFRQATAGDWAGVVARVAAALSAAR